MAMAANQTLPGLQVTAPEEDMEISDYERTADDIDIDIDIGVEPIREEDDYMVDDRSEHENKDDIMLDSDGQEDEDGMMQDNFSVPDEHLTDASEIGYVDVEVKEAPQEAADTEVRDGDQVDDFIDYDDNVTVEPKEEDQIPMQQSGTAPHPPPDAPENNQIVVTPERGDASFQQAAENSTASHQAESLNQEAGAQDVHTCEDTSCEQAYKDAESSDMPANPSEESVDKSPVGASQESHVSGHQPETDTNAPEETPTDHEAAGKHGDQDLVQSPKNVDSVPVSEPSHGANQDENDAESFDGAVNLTHEKLDVEEQQNTTTHSLHPVVVVYNEEEISLFPPNDGDTSGSYYFLQDEELAHGSIRSLLDACRQVLGDTVQHEDELEIDVAELGLRVSEESLDAAQCTFAQVLDAYIQLHRNDGVETPGPLYVALSTRTKFSARLQSIMKAVSDGKGMSQLPLPDYTAEEEPYSDSSDQHQQEESESHAEESGQATDANDAANVSARASLARERGDDLDRSVSQGQEVVPSAAQSTGAGADSNSADAKPEGNLATERTHYSETHEAGEEAHADELPEYNSEEETTAHTGIRTEVFATGDFSAAPHHEESDLDDVHKGDDGESHGSSTVRGDNTPATTEGGTLANSHAAEAVAENPQTETGSFVETVDVQEFGHGQRAGLAGQEGNGGEENGDAENNEPRVDGDGYAGEVNEEHGDGAQGFDESGYVGQEYEHEHAEDDPNQQQHETDYNDQEEQFDLPSDDEHDGYDDQKPHAFHHDDSAEKTLAQEKCRDGNEAEFADEEVGEYEVVENEDAHEEGDPEGNDHDGHSSHDDQSDDAYTNQTAETNKDATLAELGTDTQRTADDQYHPASPIAGGVDDDTIDYDDEELSRQSEDEAPTAEGVATSPSSFKRTWEEFDHGDKTADNDQALKKVKSG